MTTVRGSAVPATGHSLMRAGVRHPWPTATAAARIRWQRMTLHLYMHGLRQAWPLPQEPRGEV